MRVRHMNEQGALSSCNGGERLPKWPSNQRRKVVMFAFLALLLSFAASSQGAGVFQNYYLAVDGAPTVATWSFFGGHPNPNANRLTFLYAHPAEDPADNHFHTMGFWSYRGDANDPTVVNHAVYTFDNGEEVIEAAGDTIPEQLSAFGLTPEPPLSLRAGTGIYEGTFTTGARAEETYSDLEIRSVHELFPFAAGTPQHFMLHGSDSYGEKWDNSLAGAVIAMELVSKSPELNIGSSTELSVLSKPGDRFVIGDGDTLAFLPVLWVDADTPEGVYSVTLRFVDVRPVGWPLGESGEITIFTTGPQHN